VALLSRCFGLALGAKYTAGATVGLLTLSLAGRAVLARSEDRPHRVQGPRRYFGVAAAVPAWL